MAPINGYQPTILLRHVVRHPLTDVTLFGKLTGNEIVIVGVRFGDVPSIPRTRCMASSDPRLLRFGRILLRVLDGKAEDVSAIPIDCSACTEFRKKVLCAARSIPRGKTVSYAGLAKMAGRPRAVRAAASVIRSNAFPLVVPCHRVVRSDGSIGGFMGKQGGWEVCLKRRLIELERDE